MEDRYVIVQLSGDTSIDGQSRPGGNFHIQEFTDGEWSGGCYSSAGDLNSKIMEFLGDD